MTDVILPSWGSRVGRRILTKHEQLPKHGGAGLGEQGRQGGSGRDRGGARRPGLRKGTRCVTHSCLPHTGGTRRSEQAPTRHTVHCSSVK